MQLNFNSEITDYDNESIPLKKDSEGNTEEVMTLGSMAITALNAMSEKDKNMAADEKINRASLSLQIHDAMKKGDGNVDVSHEDVVLIKKLMNDVYNPLPLMRAYDIMDPKPKKVETPTETAAE